MEFPKRYDSAEAEPRIQKFWKTHDIYAFTPKPKQSVFTIDTPPPTVSGKMHLGHAFSYAQGDFIARYRRMKGDAVLYPWGTDDNGLPTERLIEKKRNVRATQLERSEFIDIVMEELKQELPNFTADWKRLGISADFEQGYSTIDPHCRKTSQKSFLDLYKKGMLYRKQTPISWDTVYQTAIAQAEFENVEKQGVLNEVAFHDEQGNELLISTTRPELIPAVVAVAAHPDDERYKHLIGKHIIIPITEHKVPFIVDEDVEIDFGTGLMMVSTFGDKEDIKKWYKHKLELRGTVNKDGTLNALAGPYNGMKIIDARKQIIEDLEAKNLLKGQKDIAQNVNVYERSGKEVEYLNTSQWFVRITDFKHELNETGDKINWYPEFMQHRYRDWVDNLNWDWCVSRQRPYGVPIPVWYHKETQEIITPQDDELPIDPTETVPKAWKGKEDELTAETDVMDTWATSSVTPQIALDWCEDTEQFEKYFPMSVRLQAHDIIRTWAFYTITKSMHQHGKQPWNDIVISGHALDPKGKKMSKSKGNVVDPRKMIAKYSADALRFWAASTKLGEDLSFQEKDLVTGQKTATKLWNASRFAISHLQDYDGSVPETIESMDLWLLTKFHNMVEEATHAFNHYEYSKTKLEVENFFWNTFCDNYLEIIKDRMYNPEERGADARLSAQYTLYTVLLGQLKLLAPIMPHITEDIYQHFFAEKEEEQSIHISAWPQVDKLQTDADVYVVGEAVVELIAQVRKYKSERQLSLGSEIEKASLTIPDDQKKRFEGVLTDFQKTARIQNIHVIDGPKLHLEL